MTTEPQTASEYADAAWKRYQVDLAAGLIPPFDWEGDVVSWQAALQASQAKFAACDDLLAVPVDWNNPAEAQGYRDVMNGVTITIIGKWSDG